MNESRPVIAKINIVARNFAETLKFYRLLGLEIPNAMDQPPGALHAEAEVVGGMEFAIDNEVLARIYNAGWRTNAGNTSVLLTASLGSREEVDATFERLISAGYVAHQPPYDAFWGARYAIVSDPEGNDVGLMSPIDPAFQSWPPVDSPAK
jgi:uncharacterized glyoxalase superfamily protein PhnB